MRVTILGSTGGVGRCLVREALEAGHEVTAVARPERVVAMYDGLRVVRGEVMQPGFLEEVLDGSEAVLSALGMRRRVVLNPWSSLLSPRDLNSVTARHIVSAMRRPGVRRVVVVSSAGVAESGAQMNTFMKWMVASSKIGVAYADLARMESVFAQSGLDWCCVRPVRLTDGPRTDAVRVVPRFGALEKIARSDVAAWMVRALEGEIEHRLPQIAGP